MAKLILEKYLEQNDISKNEFARMLEVNPPVVRRFIKPDYNPTLKTLNNWASTLGCKVSDLLEENTKKSRKSKK